MNKLPKHYSSLLLKSLAIIGSAQMLNVGISMFRMKLLAVLLGPNGVAIAGVYSNFLSMIGTGFGLGLDTSGVKKIASSSYDVNDQVKISRVLLNAFFVQGLIGALLIILARDYISISIFGNYSRAFEIGLVGGASILSMLGVANTAILQGLKRIKELAKVLVLSSACSTGVSVFVIYTHGNQGIVFFVISQPIFTLLFARWYLKDTGHNFFKRMAVIEALNLWKSMALMGLAFMLGNLISIATVFIIRTNLISTIGLAEAGYFTAAWGITATYAGFLMNSMTSDYFPRLSEVICNKKLASKLINDQLQLGLTIAGPILLLMMGIAPWVVKILYSDEFFPATELVQWFMVAIIYKVASWSFSYAIVAAGRSKTYFCVELMFNTIFCGISLSLLSVYGLNAIGMGLGAAYVFYLMVSLLVVKGLGYFRWEDHSYKLLSSNLILSGSTFAVTKLSMILGICFSIAAALVMLFYGLKITAPKLNLDKNSNIYKLFKVMKVI